MFAGACYRLPQSNVLDMLAERAGTSLFVHIFTFSSAVATMGLASGRSKVDGCSLNPARSLGPAIVASFRGP